MAQPDRLAGQVAIVTGAGRGIGRGIAELLANDGATVIATDLDTTGIEEPSAAPAEKEGRIVAIRADVADRASVETLVSRVAMEWGRIDILVNNAGFARSCSFLEESQENWDRHVRTNLTGAFNCSQAAARVMAEAGYGRIISIASVAGLMGPIDFAAYGASKAGILGLTRAMALDLADHGITANAIAPGPIDTEMLRANWTPEALAERSRHIPVGRFGKVEEIAFVVSMVASPEAGYLNGVVIPVDGGSVAGGAYMVEKYRRIVR